MRVDLILLLVALVLLARAAKFIITDEEYGKATRARGHEEAE